MTGPIGFDLLELATPYALNAVSETERTTIDGQLTAAPSAVADAFDDEVRAVREAMAVVSATTAIEPPDRLRAAVLAGVRQPVSAPSRWRKTLLAAAAAVVVALAAFGAGIALRPSHPPTMAEQVMAASDMHSASTPIAGGTATVLFSRTMNGAVLLMNNVPPPSLGTVYQIWLVGEKGPQSAGTMNAAAIKPTTSRTLMSLDNSSVLAFTVEPGDGSPQPTGKIFAKLSLT